MDYLKVGLLL